MRLMLWLLAFPLLGVVSASAAPAIGIEGGTQLYDHRVGGASLYLLDLSWPARPIGGRDTYYQFNIGGWTGSDHASTLGLARGLCWGRANFVLSVSLGISLVSQTSERLSTAFEFYEQIMVARRLGPNQIGVGLRHWSNGGIKQPNDGLTFLTAQWSQSW